MLSHRTATLNAKTNLNPRILKTLKYIYKFAPQNTHENVRNFIEKLSFMQLNG